MGDAFPCSPQGLGIEPGGSRPTSNTELFKPVSIVGGIYSSGLTSHPEKIFRENESNDNRLLLQGDTFRSTDKLADPDVVKNILILQETGKKREKKYNTTRLCL